MAISYQFKSADADVILLTIDEAEFRLHKCILAAASSFFNDMFALPPGAHLDDKELAVIPVVETAHNLDTVLRYIYPVPDPTINSLDDLAAALSIATKYDFTIAINTLRKLLVSPAFLPKSPIRVYAIACHYDFEEEVQIASLHTLKISLLDAAPCKELQYISAYDYYRLLVLHRRRSAAALELLKAPGNMKCMNCNTSAFTAHDAPPKWWHNFEASARAELAVRPTTDVIFRMEFLFKGAQDAGCTRCPESILSSWKFLEALKEKIDALPSTVSSRET